MLNKNLIGLVVFTVILSSSAAIADQGWQQGVQTIMQGGQQVQQGLQNQGQQYQQN